MRISPIRGAFACLLLALPIAAATGTNAAKNASKAAKAAAVRQWTPQALSGTIEMIEPAQKLVIVKAQDGTPYDLRVTSGTRIQDGSRAVRLADLKSDAQKKVSVRFTPELRGDMARSIRISE